MLSFRKNPVWQVHTVFCFALQEICTVPLRQGLQFRHRKRVSLKASWYWFFLQPHTVFWSTVQGEISTWSISFRHMEQLMH